MTLRASLRGDVPPFIVMEVMTAAAEREAQGLEVLHLEVGQPSTGAPSKVLAAARAGLDQDRLGYTLALGTEGLRARIARHYQEEYGVAVPVEQVVVTTGSSTAFLLAFMAAFEPGDRVAVAAPGYPAYRNILAALGIEVVLVPVGPDSRFQITAEVLAALGPQRLDGVVVASPSNPTGSMLSADELRGLADWCFDHGVRLVSDEIYHGIVFGPKAATAAGRDNGVIIINSFSKYYSMTGWRLGWMIVPPDLARSVECLAQNMFIAPPTLAQLAAEQAFDCREELDANVARYGRNREILLRDLPKAGLHKLAPADGAFYLYADVRHLTDDSRSLCRRILAETGVAVTPGIDFDPLEGHHFLRLSFAGSEATMEEACRRLAGLFG